MLQHSFRLIVLPVIHRPPGILPRLIMMIYGSRFIVVNIKMNGINVLSAIRHQVISLFLVVLTVMNMTTLPMLAMTMMKFQVTNIIARLVTPVTQMEIINMCKILNILLFLGFTTSLFSQNPHGAEMKINCASCHSPEGWEITAEFWQDQAPEKPVRPGVSGVVRAADSLRFQHSQTKFELLGQHQLVDCRSCHETLVFTEASTECISCHVDIHHQTVGVDCARCHNSEHWLIDNITEIHQENGFPLTGVHLPVSCEECHISASSLQFNRLGNDCINCHLTDYNATTNPNHQQSGFPTDCLECHDLFTPDWTTDNINHDFFPLTKGHDISDCAQCHTGGNFAGTPTNCVACHQQDFDGTMNPNHVSAGFSNDCIQCHTTDVDWMPAEFPDHDAQFFPIYSGTHEGHWTSCTDCHLNPSNYAEYSCIVCHTNPQTNNDHDGINGYTYENTACLACHPTGEATGAFDHNTTDFPLTGGHLTAECLQCHANGYAGTPTQCAACHTTDFNQTNNPDHETLGFPTNCAMCHTTAPGWEPATFTIHNDYYVLNGAHANTDCNECHINGNYNNTPTTCIGCHTDDFNTANNPNHITSGFPTTCQDCHSNTSWDPSTFDHDDQWFPIYSGQHNNEWDQCIECHTTPGNFALFSCIDCHEHDDQADLTDEHDEVSGFQYNSLACYTCHPDGSE